MTNLSSSPAAELLLCCARIQPDSATVERVHQLLRGELDWNQVDALATRHKIQPLLFWNLRTIGPERVPPDVLARLKKEFQSNAWLNHHLSRELVGIVQLFEAHGIPAIPLKGVVLAASVYGDLSLRQAGDIDLLVPERDTLRARALLNEQGFTSTPLTAEDEAAYLQSALHFTFSRAGTRAALELHWDLHPKHIPHQFNFDELWRRTEPVTLAGTAVASLPPADLLLYLCMHGTGHRWSNLRWLCDITGLIRRRYQEIGWDRLLEQAARDGIRRMVLLGLLLCHQLLDAPLPPIVWSSVAADAGLKSLTVQEKARLFQAPGSIVEEDLSRFTYRLRTLDNLRARVHYVRHILAPYNTTRKKFNLPRSFSFLYYLFRPVRFSIKYALSLLKP